MSTMTNGSAASIAIVIPVYNGEQYLAQAVESALVQTVSAQIVIVDDASTDGTAAILRRYANLAEVQLHRLDQRVPAPAAWNAAIRRSSAPYFVVLAHDDLLDREFVAKAQDQIGRCPEANLIIFSYREIDSSGQPRREVRVDRDFAADGRIDERTFADRFCRRGQFFVPTSTLTRRACFDQLGGFDERLKVAYDWDFYLRAATLGADIIVRSEPLASYRLHETQSILRHTSTDNGDNDLIFQKLGELQKHLTDDQMAWLVANMCSFLRRTATSNLANPQVDPKQLVERRRQVRAKLEGWRDSGSPGASYVRLGPSSWKQRLAWFLIGQPWAVRIFRAIWNRIGRAAL
jgi:glycosyltransferase involved in cell wall biosynthesis